MSMGGNADPIKSKFLELEGIRGLAAFLVFLHHIPNWNATFYGLNIVRNGYLMVDLFFVLSGYVIYSNYGTRIYSLKDLCRFQFLRLGRLYPVHLTVLAAFFAAEIAKFIAQRKFGLQFGLPAFTHFSPANTIANLTLTQELGFNAALVSINGPSWSISTEFYTYLLFALITLYVSLYRVSIYTLITASALLLLACSGKAFFDLHGDLLRCLAGFFLGCLTAMYSAAVSGKKLPAVYREAAIVLFLAFLCLKQEPGHLLTLAIYPLSALLIFTTTHSRDGLLHIAQYFAVIAITLLISYFSYRFIEQPWRMKSRAKAAIWFDYPLNPMPSIIR